MKDRVLQLTLFCGAAVCALLWHSPTLSVESTSEVQCGSFEAIKATAARFQQDIEKNNKIQDDTWELFKQKLNDKALIKGWTPSKIREVYEAPMSTSAYEVDEQEKRRLVMSIRGWRERARAVKDDVEVRQLCLELPELTAVLQRIFELHMRQYRLALSMLERQE